MRYVLIIKRLETNEQYERELEEWERQHKYHMPIEHCPRPEMEKEVIALQTIVDEEEFNAIRIAALQSMDPKKDNK